MTFKNKDYYPVLHQTKDLVDEFREAFTHFEKHMVLHFNRVLHQISVEEPNAYLYQK